MRPLTLLRRPCLASPLLCRPGPSQPRLSRSVWTSHTTISNDPELLSERVDNHGIQRDWEAEDKPLARIFTISKNTPTSTVNRLLADIKRTRVPSVGCLSEALPREVVDRLSDDGKWNLQGTAPENVYSFAQSTFYATGSLRGDDIGLGGKQRAVVFRTGMTGRAPVSVGREIPSGPRKDERGLDVSDAGFEAFMSGRKWGFGDQQREGGEPIAELDGLDPSSVKQIIFFGADRTQPVLNALAAFPESTTLGLVGSSTPFHSPTHAPFSLFHNGELSSTGAVGVAIVNEQPYQPLQVTYSGMQSVGEPVQVTTAKGNIVLTLDGQNAARLLLGLVQAMPETIAAQGKTAAERSQHKETEFYAAVFDRKPETPLDLTKARHVSRIMAGDPSRGAMSVETEEDVAVGSYIVFLTRSASPPPTPLPPHPSGLTFVSLPPSYVTPHGVEDAPPVPENADGSKGSWLLVGDLHLAASENGVVVGRGDGSGMSWVCGVEGAVASLPGWSSTGRR